MRAAFAALVLGLLVRLHPSISALHVFAWECTLFTDKEALVF
jgi:hypothetical protein